MNRGRPILIAILAVSVSAGAAILLPSKVVVRKSVTVTTTKTVQRQRVAAPKPPTPFPTFAIVKPPKPFHIPLFWEPIPGASTYKLYVGSNSLPAFTSVWETANNFIAASNLWHGTEYTFAVTSVDTNGVESDYSPLLHWPRPVTNYLAFGVSASKLGFWSTNMIVTNPPNLFFCRLQRLPNALQFQTSTNLRAWLSVTDWAMTNPPGAFYLHQSHWDNVNGYERPD